MNAYMERWFRSLKSECLDRMIFFGRKSLENAVHEYVQHYHGERNHQGLGNEVIEPVDAAAAAGKIGCLERPGGMLKCHHQPKDILQDQHLFLSSGKISCPVLRSTPKVLLNELPKPIDRDSARHGLGLGCRSGY
ncbi:MAG: transposase [Fuerstiella sp.]|nr:transposase [Fuerstiella sp.]